ncbi:MAG: HlyD family efflux transporter periplasmic adaptor subunit [Acutalibacteraceae bacterium]
MKGTTVLKGFVILLIAVFAVHQAVSSLYKPVKTETAVYSEMSDGLNITGVIIRNETLVTAGDSGVLHFIIGDGNRVAKDGVIANIYDSESASIILEKIDSVNGKIADIEEMLSYNNLEAADLDMINAKVRQNLNALIVSGGNGNYGSFSDKADELLSSYNRRQAAMGETSDFSAQLAALKSEKEQLSASLPAAKGTLRAERSGYFVSKADGYEKVLTCDNPESITPEYLSSVKAESVGDGVVGKIVSDYEWYIAAEVSINESLNYKEGDSLTIYTSVKSYPKLPVTVKKINISESSGGAVVLFACNDMNSELASMRTGPMTVVKKEYSGLKVPVSARRVVDSKIGVYVLTGMQVKFVEVNVLFTDGDYLICEKQTSDDTVLRLYDEVIVKGKNLYDGKIIS